MQHDMLGSSIIQTKAAIVVRLSNGDAEVVKNRYGEELEASIHIGAKAARAGVKFLVLTPKE